MTSILAVDSSPSMQKMATYALEHTGYGIVIVQDKQKTSSTAESTSVDTMVSDVYMFKIDSIASVKSTHQIQNYRFKPFDSEKQLSVSRSVLN